MQTEKQHWEFTPEQLKTWNKGREEETPDYRVYSTKRCSKATETCGKSIKGSKARKKFKSIKGLKKATEQSKQEINAKPQPPWPVQYESEQEEKFPKPTPKPKSELQPRPESGKKVLSR